MQQCPSNVRLCRKNRSTCRIRQCCFDIVASVDGALGIFVDAGVTVGTHVSKTVASCFVLRQLRSMQRSVSRPVLLPPLTSLVLSRLDYESATLAGIPKYLLDRLQSVLNARLICRARKYGHVSPLLQ